MDTTTAIQIVSFMAKQDVKPNGASLIAVHALTKRYGYLRQFVDPVDECTTDINTVLEWCDADMASEVAMLKHLCADRKTHIDNITQLMQHCMKKIENLQQNLMEANDTIDAMIESAKTRKTKSSNWFFAA